MKLAVSGKGGVGKTTFASLLIRTLSDQGKKVLAIDADPDANLASGLGIPGADKIVPIAEMTDLICERTGAQPGTVGGYFKLNPQVDDLPDALSAKLDNIKFMRLGGVKKGGAGCICPESTLLRALVMHIVLRRDEVVVMDMEAGIEHLRARYGQGRGQVDRRGGTRPAQHRHGRAHPAVGIRDQPESHRHRRQQDPQRLRRGVLEIQPVRLRIPGLSAPG